MIRELNKLLSIKGDRMKLAVVACQDEDVLEAVIESSRLGISEPILIGSMVETKAIAKKLNIDISDFEFIDEEDLASAAEIGVRMVSEGKADFIMKGLVDTSILLKAVLNKDWGLRTDSLLSHVMVYDVDTYHKLLYLTDGGMNLNPSLEEKKKIIKNSIIVARAMGCENVKIAALAAKEKVNPKMQATVDANELKNMAEEGAFGKGVILEGPLALDLALSKEAARIKKIESPVAGDADVLLVPNIEMGNGIGKAITYLANGKSAGIIMGAKAPVVLVSRADDKDTKLFSIALGNMISSYLRKMA
ncbi:bifunctional enoyl-CoA hydratase/phosphate acetyltransferase [Gudongella sp. SC589]|jgi:phosphate butyryltransferase|uniref:bifunctional enoyl-CoA hydratase/phosphate acetyltransferase n=1 Tax=Gudongella sp. SC589 TaxID=3385990 RepID=UPI003904AD21